MIRYFNHVVNGNTRLECKTVSFSFMYIRIFFGLPIPTYRSRRCVVVHAAEANMSMICFKITLLFHNGTSSQRIYISADGSPQAETRKWKYLNIFCLYVTKLLKREKNVTKILSAKHTNMATKNS